MPSKDQYEFFRSLYEEEERTYEQLESKAKVYLGIVTVFVATMLFKASTVDESLELLKVPWWPLLIVGTLLCFTLVFIVLALRIKTYEAVNDPEEIIENFGENLPSDEEFFEERIADYAVAASRNRGANNGSANLLEWAGRFLVASMIMLIVIFSIALKGL